jgi:hypothetical protein
MIITEAAMGHDKKSPQAEVDLDAADKEAKWAEKHPVGNAVENVAKASVNAGGFVAAGSMAGLVGVGGLQAIDAVLVEDALLGPTIAAAGSTLLNTTAATLDFVAPAILPVGVAAGGVVDAVLLDKYQKAEEQINQYDRFKADDHNVGHLKVVTSIMHKELAAQGVEVDKYGNIDFGSDLNRQTLEGLLVARNNRLQDEMKADGFHSEKYNLTKSDLDFTGAAQDELRHLNHKLAGANSVAEREQVLASSKIKPLSQDIHAELTQMGSKLQEHNTTFNAHSTPPTAPQIGILQGQKPRGV